MVKDDMISFLDDLYPEIRERHLSIQERDLLLFLNSLGIHLPPVDPRLEDDYLVMKLPSLTASLFNANDNKAVLLAYRVQGTVFPISIVFLKGYAEILFCHSTLLLDSYSQGDGIGPTLRKATQNFFSMETNHLLEAMDPSWINAPLDGQRDCRIIWNVIPDMDVVVDLFMEKFGRIREIPVFPSVYYYNNPYEQNIIEAALPELDGCRDVLILGTGAGLEAVCVALKYGIHVDAIDINPIAVANTISAGRRTGTEHLIHAWVSNGLKHVRKMYDAILFEAPLATDQKELNDPNRYDQGGNLLRKVLSDLPSHIRKNGRMYLMSCADISPYVPKNGLKWEVIRHFEAKSHVAIHKIWRG
jgi:hypothetical protein